ncbi:hypothetical protein BSKO_11405 [Bryopsis sp. KO-2023]|nr:hypothetical protein BSKO_11405 [Bryopsis sp. KO-2023]
MFRACGALPALGCPAQQHKPVPIDALRPARLGSNKPTPISIRGGAGLPCRATSSRNPEPSELPSSERLEFSGPGGSDGHGGNSGGWNGGNGGDNGDGDGNDFFSGGLILFLAGIPFIIDTTRRLSFGKDGIRVLQLGAEPGLPRPIFAAVAMGRSAGPPEPAAQSMSGGGGTGSFIGGVLAILILCAGGYYILGKKKRGSGAPVSDDDELQMEPVGNVGTREPDPSLFQRPVAEASQAEPSQAEPSQAEPSQAEPGQTEPSQTEASQAEASQAEPIQAESAPASVNPLVDHMDEKDKFFVNGDQNSILENMAAIPAPSSSPPESAAPPATATLKQPTPDDVVQDRSSAQPTHVPVDHGDKTGNFFMADLWKKDDMFGRPAEPDMAPVKLNDTTPSQKPAASSSTDAVNHSDFLQQQIEKDKFFGAGDGRSEVVAHPVSAPEGFGSVEVPEAPSSAVNVKTAPPVNVVKVYDSMPHEGAFLQEESEKASLLKDMEAKDLMFAEKPPNGTFPPHEVEIPRQILDVVSGPIMTDIAKQLEGKDDENQMVGVGLDVAGEKVALKLNFMDQEGPGVAAPTTPTTVAPSKAVSEDTNPVKSPLVAGSPKASGTTPEKTAQGEAVGDGEHEEEGSASPPEEGSASQQAPPKKKKRTRRSRKHKKPAPAQL